MQSHLTKGLSAPSTPWNDLLVRRLFQPELTPGLAHLAIWALSKGPTVTPGTAAGAICKRHPDQRLACALALDTLLLAAVNHRPLDTPVQYLGALWEFQGSHVLLEALVSLPEELADAIAAEHNLPRQRHDESARLRLRQAAIDAWHFAQYGDEI